MSRKDPNVEQIPTRPRGCARDRAAGFPGHRDDRDSPRPQGVGGRNDPTRHRRPEGDIVFRRGRPGGGGPLRIEDRPVLRPAPSRAVPVQGTPKRRGSTTGPPQRRPRGRLLDARSPHRRRRAKFRHRDAGAAAPRARLPAGVALPPGRRGEPGRRVPRRAGGTPLPPPWHVDDLSRACGVDPARPEERHTALGDARWAMRLYDAIVRSR